MTTPDRSRRKPGQPLARNAKSPAGKPKIARAVSSAHKSAARRSPCPVACTLDLLGDKWSLLIVRDMLCGKTHYRHFLGSPERIATNILADRLSKLVATGIARAEPSAEREGSTAYHLTDRGRSLLPVLEAIRNWGLQNIRGTQARLSPPV